MGNASKKLAEKCDLLTKEEQKSVAATFKAASRNSAKIREEDLIVSGKVDAELLEKLWGPQIDPRLSQYLSNFLFGSGPDKQAACDFNRFAELYVYNVRGTPDERMSFIVQSLGKADDGIEIPYQLLKEYCESIASTYIKIVKAECPRRASPWLEKGFRGGAAAVQALGEAVAAAVCETDEPRSTHEQMRKWLNSETLLKQLAETVFTHLYGTNKLLSAADDASLLPLPEGLEAMPDYPAFTDLCHVAWLNSYMPREHQHKWRFLFSSHIHGESFATLNGRIIDQGPSIIIIEDNAGHIFGGFASSPWGISPNWAGSDSSFLFTLAPRMRIYHASGFNDHYQYMNQHTKTLPNGLILGGQLDFAAIWLPADPFGEGSSAESCTTYRGYRRLSKEQHFHVKSLEVWGVGNRPMAEDTDERDTSILDGNPEAKAILEMAGKTRHSEGLREPPPL